MPIKRIRVKPTTRHTMHGVVHVRGYTKDVHVEAHHMKRHRRRMH